MFKAHKSVIQNAKPVKWTASNDNSISFNAKGILYYFLLKPDEWKGHIFDLQNNSTDSNYKIRKGIKELVDAGYLRLVRTSKNGSFNGSYYEYADEPIFKSAT